MIITLISCICAVDNNNSNGQLGSNSYYEEAPPNCEKALNSYGIRSIGDYSKHKFVNIDENEDTLSEDGDIVLEPGLATKSWMEYMNLMNMPIDNLNEEINQNTTFDNQWDWNHLIRSVQIRIKNLKSLIESS